MNYHQLTKVLLVLLCLSSSALAGVLPSGGSGGSGYQYNRPGAGGFGDGSAGGSYRRPTTSYGPPGGGGDGGGFGRPSTNYGAPGQFGSGGGYQDGGYQGSSGGYGRDNGRPQPYSFQYEVYDPPSGNDYSQRESSDGNVVTGEYRVLLPDSRTQIVKYMADDANGYTADVQYEGQAQYSRGGAGAYGGAGGYPGGAGGYQGGYSDGRGGYGGDAANNQYLPPRNSYRK